jgi:hypothetical protein
MSFWGLLDAAVILFANESDCENAKLEAIVQALMVSRMAGGWQFILAL